jgi:DNA-binding GntR family transcriptional regulator
MTVNRALRELAEKGVLKRFSGVGTFIADEKPQSTLLMIAHIGDEIRARGHDYRSLSNCGREKPLPARCSRRWDCRRVPRRFT